MEIINKNKKRYKNSFIDSKKYKDTKTRNTNTKIRYKILIQNTKLKF